MVPIEMTMEYDTQITMVNGVCKPTFTSVDVVPQPKSSPGSVAACAAARTAAPRCR